MQAEPKHAQSPLLTFNSLGSPKADGRWLVREEEEEKRGWMMEVTERLPHRQVENTYGRWMLYIDLRKLRAEMFLVSSRHMRRGEGGMPGTKRGQDGSEMRPQR
ncbi:hypothetical protein E2C01_083729 [Portunus trituberculatus]|uniref:Uncharacterized protein n=1 Tax=Portunus trituberculatus TaxID=210409 RepID=A0A5B7J7B6_PORTR|nr:hypothetical protein [Portunus trituberculatus]